MAAVAIFGHFNCGERCNIDPEHIGGISRLEIQVGVPGRVRKVGFVFIFSDVFTVTLTLPVINTAREGGIFNETCCFCLWRNHQARHCCHTGDSQRQRTTFATERTHRLFLFDELKRLKRRKTEKTKWSGVVRNTLELTTVFRLFFATRIINAFNQAKVRIMTKSTYFVVLCNIYREASTGGGIR